MTVSSKAVLVRARTFDADDDGFLDAFDFFFNLPPSSPLSPTSVSVHVDSRYAAVLAPPAAMSMT